MSDWTGVKTSRLFSDWMYKDPEYKKEIEKCDKDEIILPKGKTYTLTITYPLTTPFKIEFNTKKKALNRKEVVNYIVECYKNIYKIEDGGKKVPMIPGMYNRITTKGQFGIWGHCLSDLMLHTLYINGNKLTVSCDS